MTDPAQEALLRLQDLDTAIDQHHHRRATLSERAQLAETERDLAAARAARDEAAAKRDEVARRQETLEGELATSEGHIADLERRLTTGGVGTAREVEALTSSSAHYRERVSELEDHILEAMEERGPLDEQADAATSEVSTLERREQEQREQLAAAETVIDGELRQLEHERREAVGAVPETLLGTYDRLRRRLDGVAVARLVGDHCDGCHLTLPATELDHLKHAPADEVAYCDQCGRILVRS